MSTHSVVLLGDSDRACYVAGENVVSEGLLTSLPGVLIHDTVPAGLESSKCLLFLMTCKSQLFLHDCWCLPCTLSHFALGRSGGNFQVEG